MANLPFEFLKPTEFEKFSYELLDSMGFVNLDWRKGSNLLASPADQGRDIIGQLIKTDIDGSKSVETWFVECKHHKKTVPPTQLQNLLSWAEAEKPHTALFIISGYLSNPAKEYLEKYKRNRKPPFNIKIWERPSIEKICHNKRALLRKHGLLDATIRKIEEIFSAEGEYFDKVWYNMTLPHLLYHYELEYPALINPASTGMPVENFSVSCLMNSSGVRYPSELCGLSLL